MSYNLPSPPPEQNRLRRESVRNTPDLHLDLPLGAVDSQIFLARSASGHRGVDVRTNTPGFERSVLVQATYAGNDNSDLISRLAHSQNPARGVITVNRNVSRQQLLDFHAAGVRGVRFDLSAPKHERQQLGIVGEIAERIEPLGWHLLLPLRLSELRTFFQFYINLPTAVVLEPFPVDTQALPDDASMDMLMRLLEYDNFWCKLGGTSDLDGPEGVSRVQLYRRIIEGRPGRVLWGSDASTPDIDRRIDFIAKIAPTESLQQRLLVTNPMRLYWPEVR